MAREAPLAGVGQFRDFRNGRKMQDSLPLWQEAEDRGGPGSASRRGRPVPGLPQRQENAGFAAVVARSGGPGCRKGRRAGQVGRAEASLRSLPYDAAVEHTDDAVGLLGLGLVVGHHQDGLAALLVDLVQELHNLGTHLGVQVTGGLVR